MCALRGGPGEAMIPTRLDVTPAVSLACISGAPANDNGSLSTHHRIEGRTIARLVVERLLLGTTAIALIATGACLLGADD